MNVSLPSLALVLGLFASVSAFAQAPAAAPAGSTGLCKDGSYTSNETKKGACSGHHGVKEWFGAAETAAPAKPATAAKSATDTWPAAPATPATKPPAVTTKAAAGTGGSAGMTGAAAAGGGPGQVWVNTNSKVYHCQGTKYYGKTKEGEYMSESAAKAAGNHADHGKACS
jgi:hypothetical protein